MYSPLVSVIIGTRNRSKLIERAVNSVLQQSHKNIEVIIVDDDSEDDTWQTLQRLKRNNVHIIKNQENLGISKVSNIAFKKSKGEYIALLGDDDEWFDKDKVKSQLYEFEKNKYLGVCATWYRRVTEEAVKDTIKNCVPKDLSAQVLMNNIFCGSTAIITREAWIKAGGFDENLKRGTDSDLFRRIVLSGYEGVVCQIITTNVYLDSANRMTPSNDLQSLTNSVKMIEYIFNKYKNEYYIYKVAGAYRTYYLASNYHNLFNFNKDIQSKKSALQFYRTSLLFQLKSLRFNFLIKTLCKMVLLSLNIRLR